MVPVHQTTGAVIVSVSRSVYTVKHSGDSQVNRETISRRVKHHRNENDGFAQLIEYEKKSLWNCFSLILHREGCLALKSLARGDVELTFAKTPPPPKTVIVQSNCN